MDYVRCSMCKGSKTYAPLGFIYKECPTCSGSGYMESKLNSLDLTHGFVSTTDAEPITIKSDIDNKLNKTKKQQRIDQLKAKVKSKSELKRLEAQTNQAVTNQLIGV